MRFGVAYHARTNNKELKIDNTEKKRREKEREEKEEKN